MKEKTFHTNIRRRRESLGLSQEELAEAIGVSRNSYINLERGRINLFSKTLSKLAEYWHTSEEEILTGYRVEDFELSDSDSIREKLHTTIDEYEARISSMQDQIAQLQSDIANQKEIIDNLILNNNFLHSELKRYRESE